MRFGCCSRPRPPSWRVGCVDRRFVVETNVPDAQVYIDRRAVGASPGRRPVRVLREVRVPAVAPGYEPLTKRVRRSARSGTTTRRWTSSPRSSGRSASRTSGGSNCCSNRCDQKPDELLKRRTRSGSRALTLPPPTVPTRRPCRRGRYNRRRRSLRRAAETGEPRLAVPGRAGRAGARLAASGRGRSAPGGSIRFRRCPSPVSADRPRLLHSPERPGDLDSAASPTPPGRPTGTGASDDHLSSPPGSPSST